MKKLLHKLFPRYFNVKYIKAIDFATCSESNRYDLKTLEIAIVNEESSRIDDTLGLSRERSDYLSKRVRSAYIEYDSFTEAIKYMGSMECGHINELMWCIVVLSDQRTANNFQSAQSFLMGGSTLPPEL